MMKNKSAIAFIVCIFLFSVSSGYSTDNNVEYMAPPPPEDESLYPCADCHDQSWRPNKKVRKLEDNHTEIEILHGPPNRWCYECHNTANPNQLRLADGTVLEFKDSNRLCAQCHGAKFRIWDVGAHGKRVGYWNGKRTAYSCVHCHRPHHPTFQHIKPEPPPTRPRGDTGYLKKTAGHALSGSAHK